MGSSARHAVRGKGNAPSGRERPAKGGGHAGAVAECSRRERTPWSTAYRRQRDARVPAGVEFSRGETRAGRARSLVPRGRGVAPAGTGSRQPVLQVSHRRGVRGEISPAGSPKTIVTTLLSFRAKREIFTPRTTPASCHFERSEKSSPPAHLSFRAKREILPTLKKIPP